MVIRRRSEREQAQGSDALAATSPELLGALARRSFEEVFVTEYEAMVRLAFLLVDAVEPAEEIVQESFVELHRRWEKVDSPGAYLRTCVVNRCRNEQRRRGRERSARRRVEARAEAATMGLDADEMFDALAALSPKRRAAVVLRYYDDLPEREIAEVLGVRPGTVKSLLHRALADLRAALGS